MGEIGGTGPNVERTTKALRAVQNPNWGIEPSKFEYAFISNIWPLTPISSEPNPASIPMNASVTKPSTFCWYVGGIENALKSKFFCSSNTTLAVIEASMSKFGVDGVDRSNPGIVGGGVGDERNAGLEAGEIGEEHAEFHSGMLRKEVSRVRSCGKGVVSKDGVDGSTAAGKDEGMELRVESKVKFVKSYKGTLADASGQRRQEGRRVWRKGDRTTKAEEVNSRRPAGFRASQVAASRYVVSTHGSASRSRFVEPS